jgi:hypothetical protein
VTLAAVFSAIYVILRIVPTFSMIGTSGLFTAGDFILTSIAAIAGLWSGIVSVLVGTVLAYGMRPPVFLGLDFLPAAVNVSIAALLLSGRYRVSQAIYVIVLLVFLLSPYSLLYAYDHVPYVWLHLIALALLLSPIASRIPSLIRRGGYLGIAAFAFLSFVGTMAQHLTGGLLYELTLGVVDGNSPQWFAVTWRIIFAVYPEERIIIAAFSTILAVAIYRAFQRWAPPSWRD